MITNSDQSAAISNCQVTDGPSSTLPPNSTPMKWFRSCGIFIGQAGHAQSPKTYSDRIYWIFRIIVF